MIKRMDYLLKVSQIVVNIATALPIIIILFAGIGSYISNGDFFTWISAIPIWIWILIGILPIIILFYKRTVKISESKKMLQTTYLYSPDVEVLHQTEMYGSEKVGKVHYKNCLWTIYLAKGSLLYQTKGREPFESLLIEIPPKCKSCQTDLFERLRFWGGFLWECKKCNEKITSSDSFLISSQYALSIAKSETKQK